MADPDSESPDERDWDKQGLVERSLDNRCEAQSAGSPGPDVAERCLAAMPDAAEPAGIGSVAERDDTPELGDWTVQGDWRERHCAAEQNGAGESWSAG